MKFRTLKPILILLGLVILAFMAWPKFELFECRSIQSEAKAWLTHLYEAEKFYYAHHQKYASLEVLLQTGLIKSHEKNYSYDIKTHDEKDLLIVATSHNKSSLQGDTWSIDQTGEIKVIHNACQP